MFTLKPFVASWNNDHPLDKGFREKYKIAFNSHQHRETNQLDILYEYLENKMYEEYDDRMVIEIKNKELYEKGVWLKESVVEEKENELFDKIDISSMNQNQLQIDE